MVHRSGGEERAAERYQVLWHSERRWCAVISGQGAVLDGKPLSVGGVVCLGDGGPLHFDAGAFLTASVSVPKAQTAKFS